MLPRKRTPTFEGFINHHDPIAAYKGHSPLCRGIEGGYPFHEFTHSQPSPSNESPPQEYGFAKVLLREKSMVNKPFTRSYFWAWWKGVG